MSGVIYTFYSYKGGVGRSMALANLAVCFYQQNYRVLMIDMDLEAPGLERYFASNSEFDISELPSEVGFATSSSVTWSRPPHPLENTVNCRFHPSKITSAGSIPAANCC